MRAGARSLGRKRATQAPAHPPGHANTWPGNVKDLRDLKTSIGSVEETRRCTGVTCVPALYRGTSIVQRTALSARADRARAQLLAVQRPRTPHDDIEPFIAAHRTHVPMISSRQDGLSQAAASHRWCAGAAFPLAAPARNHLP